MDLRKFNSVDLRFLALISYSSIRCPFIGPIHSNLELILKLIKNYIFLICCPCTWCFISIWVSKLTAHIQRIRFIFLIRLSYFPYWWRIAKPCALLTSIQKRFAYWKEWLGGYNWLSCSLVMLQFASFCPTS